LITSLALAWARRYVARHPEPSFVIGDHQLDRWYVIRRNKLFNIYLHRFNRSDEDRAHTITLGTAWGGCLVR
jgi:hypothetical protein